MATPQDDRHWTIDELAAVAGLPVRTIREYQTMRVLEPPLRRGRLGIYGQNHLQRLRLIARLKDRGYSLAGIRDLLDAWAAGRDLSGVLDDDRAPLLDERPALLDRAQLAATLPGFADEQLAELAAIGFIDPSGLDQFWVASPSLLRLLGDLTATGAPASEATAIAAVITRGTRDIARAITPHLEHATGALSDEVTLQLLQHGRALIAQGAGRMLIHQLGLALRDPEASPSDARLAALAGKLAINAPRVIPPERQPAMDDPTPARSPTPHRDRVLPPV